MPDRLGNDGGESVVQQLVPSLHFSFGVQMKNCPKCEGDGKIQCGECYGSGRHGNGKDPCWSCKGSKTQKCYECNGTGKVR